MVMTEPEQNSLEALHAAAADSTKQCVEAAAPTSEVDAQPVQAEPDILHMDADADVPVQAEPAAQNSAKAVNSNVWVLCGVIAKSLLVWGYRTGANVLSGGLALARPALAALVRRVRAEIVTSNAVAGLILAAVFTATSAMILLLEQVMPAWRAALVTSGILAVIGFSLLQAQMVTDMTTAWARAKNLRSEVAVRVTELIRAQVRERVRATNRGGPA
jgi:hypothetical protein